MAFPRPCEVPEAHGKTSLCDKISPSLARDRSSLENGGKRTIFCFAARVGGGVALHALGMQQVHGQELRRAGGLL